MVSLVNQVAMIGAKMEIGKVILVAVLIVTLITNSCVFFRYKKKNIFILLMSIVVSTILCNGVLIL